MSKTRIKKQLKFKCLISHIQNVMKLNFVSSPKMTIFAPVNQQRGLPIESAFSRYSDNSELRQFTKVVNRNNGEMIVSIVCILCNTTSVGQFIKTFIFTTGSLSPTIGIGLRWMAPLSSLWLNLSEPRTNKKKNGTDKMSQMRKGNERQGNKLSSMRYDNGRNKGCNGRKSPK